MMGERHYNYKEYYCDICINEIKPPAFFLKINNGKKYFLTHRGVDKRESILICENCQKEIRRKIEHRRNDSNKKEGG